MAYRWRDGKVNLGALGELHVFQWLSLSGGEKWTWCLRSTVHNKTFPTQTAARRAALKWLRAALKQASKRIG